ncbi:hypothetical protein [Candidatus Pantoea bituminis]|uniref:hypothetical protein n=1 Tax=Candidatus Pantoea bituminis TaxID=2831036 RepID=UPI001C062E7A|nr:hypothetical protein [Pantoea bituminis]
MMRLALLAMGHENVWYRDTGSQVQIITWDGFVAAQLNRSSESWEIQLGANGTFSNPGGIEPDDARELTEEYAFNLSTVHP